MASGHEKVKEMYRNSLRQDRRDVADAIAATSKALGGPDLSITGAASDMSEQKYDDEIYNSAMEQMGRGSDSE